MPINRPAAPVRDALVEVRGANAGKVTGHAWLTWLRDIRSDIDAAPAGFTPVTREAMNASIGTTSIPTDGALSAGLYRVSWYLEVTTAAAVSSSAQVTIAWTSNAVSKTKVGAANNGNTTATYESNSAPLIRVDAASPITYAVTYASNGAGEMRYRLQITLERVAAL